MRGHTIFVALRVVPSEVRRRDGRVAEGARLESVFRGNSNVGSNPTLSATQSGLQRNCASIFPKIRKTCPYFAILPRQTGLERMDYSAVKGVTVPAFLWRDYVQSGFEEGIRRTQYD